MTCAMILQTTPFLSTPLRLARAMGAAACLALAPISSAFAEEHVLNLTDADIHAFIDDVAEVTGYTFIIHPAVRGKVNVKSSVPVSEDEIFDIFLATLRTLDYTVVPAGPSRYRIVPDDVVAEDETAVGAVGSRANEFATEVFQLRHVDAVEAAQMVQPLVNGRGQVTANSAANRLVIVDYAGNIERIRQILNDVDEDNSVVRSIRLENMPASEVASMVTDLNPAGQRGRDGGPGQVSAIAMPSGNTVVLRGDSVDVARAAALVRDLDAAAQPSESLRVVYLKHADVEEMVEILSILAASLAPPGVALEGGAPQIPYHVATNALVLSMEPQRLSAMMQVIEALDIRREEVLVEAIIVEISDDAARELGLQFILAGTDDETTTPFAVSNFSRSAPSLLTLAGGIIVDDDGEGGGDLQQQAINSLLGINGLAIGVGGESDGTLFGAILNAVQEDSDSNLLSTPSVKALDNELARIVVGQEVPITTGTNLSPDFDRVFSQIERKDVGVKLEFRPTINEGDVIKLFIRQEVSNVASFDATANGEPVFNTREIETTVLADDGEVIVLGGLIEVAETDAVSAVPILGSIPVAGRLFRSEGKIRSKTNLVVFLRPTILRDREDNSRAASRRYDFLRNQLQETGVNLDELMSAVDMQDAIPGREQ